jgi:HEAT repeat protein
MFQIRFLTASLLGACVTLTASTQPPPPYTPPGERVRGKTLQEWIGELTDPDASVRNAAIVAIPEFGPAAEIAVPNLIQRALHDTDAGPRCEAVIVLPKMKIADKDVPKVIEALGKCLMDNQAIIRYQAAVGLVASGEQARGALREILNAARAPQATWQIKYQLLIALQKAGRDPKTGPDLEVIKVFLEHVRHPTAQVRLQAVIGLGALGRPADPNVLVEVERILVAKANDYREKDLGIRIWANASLMALDKADEALLKRISTFLKSDKVDVRIQAARAIGTVGEKAKGAVPVLIDMLDDKEKTVACAATDALLMINAEGSTKAVIDNLKTAKEADVRAHTARAVGAYGEKIRNAVPVLVELLYDREQHVVQEACYALAQMGDIDPRGRQALLQLKERKDAPDSLKKFADQCLRLMDEPASSKRDRRP